MSPFKRTMLFVCLLVAAAAVAVSVAQGQNIGGLIGALLGIFRVQGVVFCSVNGNVCRNREHHSYPSIFKCHSPTTLWSRKWYCVRNCANPYQRNVFNLLDVSFYSLRQILSGCRTPPVGTLTSTLTSLGSTVVPLVPTINVGTGVFGVSV